MSLRESDWPRLKSFFSKYPISEVAKVKDGATCWMDRYWVVTENQEILIRNGNSPQCNSNREIAEQLIQAAKNKGYENCHIEFIPIVYLREDGAGYFY